MKRFLIRFSGYGIEEYSGRHQCSSEGALMLRLNTPMENLTI